MRLRLVQTRLFLGFLLLLGDKLAVQRQAFLVDFAPVVRDGRLSFNLCLVAGRQRLQQWPQSSDLLLNGIMLGLLRLPLGKFAFASVQPGGFCPFCRQAQGQGLQGALQSLARGRQLLLGLALQRLLIVKLTLQHQALAELIELLLVALLLLHPVVYLLRNIPRDVQRGAGLLPRFSKRLLFLCEPPGRFGVTLELLRQGLDLPEDQQAFFFQRGDLLFQRIAAALIIRERQRGVLFNRRVFTGAAQRTGLTRLEPVAVAFQVFNRFFPLAERLQVEIVLVFVFVLLPALRQGGVEFCLLRLRLLYAFGVLAQTLAQQLMLFMQGEQPLAQRSRLGLLRYRRRNVIGAQRQRAGRQRGQLLAQRGQAAGLGRQLLFIPR